MGGRAAHHADQSDSLTETREFLLTIRRSGDPLRLRDEALFSLYAMTGLRRAEALSLNFGDFDRQTGTLRLRQGKGRRVRIVPVAVPLCSLLDRLRGDDAKEGKLFPGRGAGRGLTVRQAHGRFEKWKRVTGLRPQLTIHSFRVGFATALHEQTSDAMTIARILGHRDLRMTLRYTSTSVEGMRRAIGIVGSAVGAGV